MSRKGGIQTAARLRAEARSDKYPNILEVVCTRVSARVSQAAGDAGIILLASGSFRTILLH